MSYVRTGCNPKGWGRDMSVTLYIRELTDWLITCVCVFACTGMRVVRVSAEWKLTSGTASSAKSDECWTFPCFIWSSVTVIVLMSQTLCMCQPCHVRSISCNCFDFQRGFANQWQLGTNLFLCSWMPAWPVLGVCISCWPQWFHSLTYTWPDLYLVFVSVSIHGDST